MFLLLAALAQLIRPSGHRWAVVEFRDPKPATSLYAEAVEDALRNALMRMDASEVVPLEATRRSMRKLGLTSPPVDLVARVRIGQDVGADAVVVGEIADKEILRVNGGQQGRVALRAVAYDVDTGLPVSGGLAEGASSIVPNDAWVGRALVEGAVRSAAASLARTMRAYRTPSAKIVSMNERRYTIDGGSRVGFRVGQFAHILRGRIEIAMAHVVWVELDRAEIRPEREIGSSAPGDRVWVPYEPPSLPIRWEWEPGGSVPEQGAKA